LRQRIYGICLGYEDLNDHQSLRIDPAPQTSMDREEALGSQSTFCRLENRIDRRVAVDIHKLLLEQFIASYAEPPDEIILDFDATDDPVRGNQVWRFFHGYYDHYCVLPVYVLCGDQLLVSYLRPSKIDAAKHAWAILALLVKRLREVWTEVRIIFRGDSGFCRHHMLTWCKRNGVGYLVGIAKNDALLRCIRDPMGWVEELAQHVGEKQREFFQFYSAAGTWKGRRKVIAKLEVTDQGSNPRFIVINLAGDKQALYDKVYCARGDMEREACPRGKIASRSNSWGCLPIAPVRIICGPISFGYCCRAWPTC
jgi:hypothetical protein